MKRPPYQTIGIAAARRRDWSGYILQEKLDGRWHEYECDGARFVGELMPSMEFIAHDCVFAGGESLLEIGTAVRLLVMAHQCGRLGIKFAQTCAASPADFINLMVKEGGEGIVAKPTYAPFGHGWIRAKVRETHDCRVEEIATGRESMRISERGIDRGWCPVVGGKLVDGWDYRPRIASIGVGDVVEIACHSVLPSGKLREPRFVRVRDDKVSAS